MQVIFGCCWVESGWSASSDVCRDRVRHAAVMELQMFGILVPGSEHGYFVAS
jgi:hypothetical protein